MPLIKVQIAGHWAQQEIAEGHSLLDAALIGKMNPPYSCLEGVCQTCECKLISGTLKGRPADSGKPGHYLACLSRPAADEVVITFDL